MSDWEEYKAYVRMTNPEMAKDIDEAERISASVESEVRTEPDDEDTVTDGQFHLVASVTPIQFYKLRVKFVDGITKIYDVEPLFQRFPAFLKLRYSHDLFHGVHVDGDGYGISWDDRLDLACNELYENGIMEWECDLIDYVIPENIDNRIPEFFYHAMAGELFSIGGKRLTEPREYEGEPDEDGFVADPETPGVKYPKYSYNLDSGTAGWAAAFYATCCKLDLPWLLRYRWHLGYPEGDVFDGILEERIVERVLRTGNCRCNSYYLHWIKAYDRWCDQERSKRKKKSRPMRTRRKNDV